MMHRVEASVDFMALQGQIDEEFRQFDLHRARLTEYVAEQAWALQHPDYRDRLTLVYEGDGTMSTGFIEGHQDWQLTLANQRRIFVEFELPAVASMWHDPALDALWWVDGR